MMKPPYRVMTMKEVRERSWNGFNAISTFSGCGGSSTGYRMAGFRVLWASEFIDAARDSYAANKAQYTILDGRDIRLVKAEDILSAINMKPGELDLFDGSPPCASFSTAGKREDGWGKVKKYSDKAQRTDDLFFEFARLVEGVQPKTFVAENVSGLVKGTAKGYFIEILSKLKACGYRVKCKVLDAQWLGVPQMRQRTIFIGVREDLGLDPVHPMPLPYRYGVEESLSGIVDSGESRKLSSGTLTYKYWSDTLPGDDLATASIRSTGKDSFRTHYKVNPQRPSNTITSSTQQIYHWKEARSLGIVELKRVCGFPDDFVLKGDFSQQWERLGRAVPPVMMMHIAATVRDEILAKVQ